MHTTTLIVGKGRDRPRPAERVVSICGAVLRNSCLEHQDFSMCRDDCTDEVISTEHSSRAHLSISESSRPRSVFHVKPRLALRHSVRPRFMKSCREHPVLLGE